MQATNRNLRSTMMGLVGCVDSKEKTESGLLVTEDIPEEKLKEL